jgi:hypothetical protein
VADNVVLNSGSGGVTAAADEISAGIYAQRVKPVIGADGTGVDVLPVSNGMDTTATGVPAAGIVGQFDDVGTGTVTENQFAPVRISSRRALLVEGVASGTAVKVDNSAVTQPVSAASLPLPAGASTSAKQPALGAAGSAASDVISVQGIASMTPLLVTPSLPTGAATEATLAAEGVLVGAVTETAPGTDTASSGLNGRLQRIAQRLTSLIALLPSALGANGGLKIEGVASGTIVPVGDGAGTLTVDAPVGTPVFVRLSDGSSAIATLPVSLATNTPVGTVAHDGADSGAPLKVGWRADTTFQTAVSDGDRVDALADVYGVLNVRGDHPNKWSYHEDSSSTLTGASVQSAPGAGLSVYVTDIILSLGAATALNLVLKESSTVIVGPLYLEAVNGRTIHVRFHTPKKCTANTALTVTTSAALAHGLDILGFIAP